MSGCRNLEQSEIASMCCSFEGRTADRDRTLFLLGCNTGFRVSELCSMVVGDAYDEFGNVLDEIRVSAARMKGRARSRSVPVNTAARAILTQWHGHLAIVGGLHRDNPLFPGVSGRPVGRVAVWRALTRAKRLARVPGRVATHSMRKTFAANAYSMLLSMVARGEPVDALREAADILGHVDPRATIHYLPTVADGSRRRLVEAVSVTGSVPPEMKQNHNTASIVSSCACSVKDEAHVLLDSQHSLVSGRVCIFCGSSFDPDPGSPSVLPVCAKCASAGGSK